MRLLQVLGRLLGVALLARVAQRLPGRAAWWASLVVLLVVNALPVVAVLRGSAGIGDVFLVYWFENVVVWATGIVRIATAQGPGRMGTLTINGRSRPMTPTSGAAFFALHYGLFTLVHGVFAVVIVALTGLEGGVVPVLVLSAAIAAGHLVSLGLIWFGRGERRVVSPGKAMLAPYPRMIALHLAIIGGFFFVLGGPDGGTSAGSPLREAIGVALLCGLKTLIDVGFHLALLRRMVVPAEGGDGIYGPA